MLGSLPIAEITVLPSMMEKELTHIKTVLQTCSYPYWTLVKSSKRCHKEKEKQMNMVILYLASPKKHKIQVNFKLGQTLRSRLVRPKDKTPTHKISSVVNVVQCTEEYSDLCIEETKQPLHRRNGTTQESHPLGRDLTVHLQLKKKGHSFEDSNFHVLDREHNSLKTAVDSLKEE